MVVMLCYMQTVDVGSLVKLKDLMNGCASPIAYFLSGIRIYQDTNPRKSRQGNNLCKSYLTTLNFVSE